MSPSSQPSILCPLPRRTHSNPIYNCSDNSNSTTTTINERLKRNHLLQSSQLHLSHELASSDDVLSEFLSLFTAPSESEQPSRQSILIYNNHLASSVQPLAQRSRPSQPSSPIRTTSSTPLSSSSSSASPPPSKPADDPPTDAEFIQPGLAVAPNHLSSIVSSPISRCHNPLPRHAELDVLAARLPKPFEPFAPDHAHHLSPDAEDEARGARAGADGHPLAILMPALSLEPSALSPADLSSPPTSSHHLGL